MLLALSRHDFFIGGKLAASASVDAAFSFMAFVFQTEITGLRELEDDIRRFADLTGQKLGRVSRQEAREVFRIIYRRTPPKNQQQGENAVAGDFRRVFKVVSAGLFDEIQEATGGDSQAYQILRRKDGTPYIIDWRHMPRDVTDMAHFHQRKRISRGRVQHAGSLGSQTVDIGRWKEDSRMVVPRSWFQQYLGEVKSRVGLGKSGWIPAMDALGLPVDGYANRHGGGNGTVDNKLNDQTNPTFTATNDVDYIASDSRIVESAVRSRRGYLESQIEKMLVENSRKTGLD